MRATPCSMPHVQLGLGRGRGPPATWNSAQLSGSMSSAVGSRPAISSDERASASASIGANTAVNSSQQLRRSATAGRSSTISWPSDASSSAASCGRLRAAPGRPRCPGSAAASSARSAALPGLARGRRARTARPAAAPRSRRRARSRRGRRAAAAVSATVRVSTPSIAEEVSPDLGRQRDPPALGLEADQAAAGGRDAGRAAAVVAVRDRDHARPRPPPRSRRDEPPGVRSRSHGLRVGPKRARLGDRQDPALRQRRRADDDEARRPAAAATTLWSSAATKSPANSAAERQPLARDRAVVLDRDRHAGERPRVVGADRRRPRRAPPRRRRRRTR